MIYDKLSSIENYLGVHPNLDVAVRYIMAHALDELPDGRTSLLGDSVYVNVMDARTGPAMQKKFEIHKNYMDIQIDLKGAEIIEIGGSVGAAAEDYNEDTDFGTAECERLAACRMGPGRFIVCMALEPHKPGVAAGAADTIRKCVFKVHI